MAASAVTITSVVSGSIVANASVLISQQTLLPAASAGVSAAASPAAAAAALAAALSPASAARTFSALVPEFGSPTVTGVAQSAVKPATPPFAHTWCSPSRKFCLDWVLVSASGGAPTDTDPATDVAFRMSGSLGGYVAIGFGPDYSKMVPAEVWTGWADAATGEGKLSHGFFDDYVIPVRRSARTATRGHSRLRE